MSMNRYSKWLGTGAMLLLVLPVTAWIYIKLQVSHDTVAYDSVWSPTGTCRIEAYVPRYSSYGVLGRMVALFSSNGFYRVYTKEGVELKSSEWLIWQREYPDMETARWANGHAIYPTGDGYAGWTLKECN